jgi:hypothetical protein
MKRVLIAFAAVLAGLVLGAPRRLPSAVTRGTETINPVTMDWAVPASGSVVSNTITLTTYADSLDGPMDKIEFYASNWVTHEIVLLNTVSNRNAAPAGLKVAP